MADKQNEGTSSQAVEDDVIMDKGDKNSEVSDHGSPSEATSTVSKRIQTLKNNKKAAKSRLTRAKNQLNEIFGNDKSDYPLPSKNALRRMSTKIDSEVKIISKIICDLREIYATSGEHEDNTAVIELLDNELEEIGALVDFLTENVSRKDKASSRESTKKKQDNISPEQKKLMAKEAEERLQRMEQEQKGKEDELKRLEDGEDDKDTIANFLEKDEVERGLPRTEHSRHQTQAQIKSNVLAPIKLKGVDLPNFSGADRGDYAPWKAAFVSLVDSQNIPVCEKMLRLQSSLSGKALTAIKDLGYSEAAYERAMTKLEKKYGGEQRLQIKHLTTLRNWPKVRSRNLKEMEDFQALLERVMVTITDSGALQDKSLNLLAKEKLCEYDIQVYKFWLMDHSRDDCFESFVDWIELKVEVMEEAQEEADVAQKSEKTDHRQQVKQQKARGFNTRNTSRGCVVSSCKEDHPPWVCGTFRALPVPKRKELITKAGRCYSCLATGHLSKNCTRPRRCGVEGCSSDRHSRYLHESTSIENDDSKKELRPDLPEFVPQQQQSRSQKRVHQTDQMNSVNEPINGQGNQQRTHKTRNADNVSLMVLPAIISNRQRKLKVNVMLDSCSTSSYITEAAASELELHGQPISLTIVGTGGTEVQKQSSCVNLTVSNLEGTFEACFGQHCERHSCHPVGEVEGEMATFQRHPIWEYCKTWGN
ncbi:uncharacterized protein LOC114533211 [Dendronephthya gigantea]|uniref:uncharacterized protein LOC114533211 n=1 Tax=Dendronephthya gigantea TaxID=151771 RepID=UPI001069AA8E|nr:uncharacterized protein LOC114533211 [Dendronephthya gigantea]